MPQLTDPLTGDQVNAEGIWLWDAAANTWVQAKNAKNLAAGDTGAGLLAVADALWNGATFDPDVTNQAPITLLASAARTTTTPGPEQTNFNGKGCVFALNITAAVGTGLALQMGFKDPVSGTYQFNDILTALITGTGVKFVLAYPGGPAGNAGGVGPYTMCWNSPLPRTWTAQVRHSDANSNTYSLAYWPLR